MTAQAEQKVELSKRAAFRIHGSSDR